MWHIHERSSALAPERYVVVRFSSKTDKNSWGALQTEEENERYIYPSARSIAQIR